MFENSRSSRNLTIDRLRGALVMLMVMGDYISGIKFVPTFLKHAPDLGLTIADTVAPAFIFVIGLNFAESFKRRASVEPKSAYQHFATRYLSFIGIGAIIAGGANMVGQPTDWGVLQSIGVAGLICLPFIRTSTLTRFITGALMLASYEFVLQTSMLETVLNAVHGGLFGSISWAALLILSTAVADIWRKGLKPYLLVCLGLSIAAAFAAVLLPVSKHRVSLSFVLITLALIAVTFLILDLLSTNRYERPGLFSWWGQHALGLYVLHLVVLGIFVTPPMPWWYAEAPVWLAAIQLALILGVLSLFAWWMNKRQQSARAS